MSRSGQCLNESYYEKDVKIQLHYLVMESVAQIKNSMMTCEMQLYLANATNSQLFGYYFYVIICNRMDFKNKYNIMLILQYLLDNGADVNFVNAHRELYSKNYIESNILYEILRRVKDEDCDSFMKIVLKQPRINVHKTMKYQYNKNVRINAYRYVILDNKRYQVMMAKGKSVEWTKLTNTESMDMIQIHAYIDCILSLTPLGLPTYILLWILDWVPEFDYKDIKELRKIRIIESVVRIYGAKKQT